MRFTIRPAKRTDFEVVYRACYYTFGYGDEPRADVEREWSRLANAPCRESLIVEDAMRAPGERAVAVGQAVFVTDAYVSYVRSGAQPYVNRLVINPLPDGSQPLLPRTELRDANAETGLNVLVTHWGWTADSLDADESVRVRDYLTEKFAHIYGGYNIKEILMEVSGKEARERALNYGFRLRTGYRDYYRRVSPPPPHLHPYLMGATRAEALAGEGTRLSHLFVYTPPRFHFTPQEQELLRRALLGQSDADIGAGVDRSVEGIKKRWTAIYKRVATVDSTLLPAGGMERARGQEKRRVLLDYLRDHPEELRPISLKRERAASAGNATAKRRSPLTRRR